MSKARTRLRNDLIRLYQRTIDYDDPDRQYIGFLADKSIELCEEYIDKELANLSPIKQEEQSPSRDRDGCSCGFWPCRHYPQANKQTKVKGQS